MKLSNKYIIIFTVIWIFVLGYFYFTKVEISQFFYLLYTFLIGIGVHILNGIIYLYLKSKEHYKKTNELNEKYVMLMVALFTLLIVFFTYGFTN